MSNITKTTPVYYWLLCVATLVLLMINSTLYSSFISAIWQQWISHTGVFGYLLAALAAISVYLIARLFLITQATIKSVRYNILFLNIVGANAVAIGFLGTIVGLVSGLQYFQSVQGFEELMTVMGLVVGGLNTSLYTTVGGLSISIVDAAVTKFAEGKLAIDAIEKQDKQRIENHANKNAPHSKTAPPAKTKKSATTRLPVSDEPTPLPMQQSPRTFAFNGDNTHLQTFGTLSTNSIK